MESDETIFARVRQNAEKHPDQLLYAFLDKHGQIKERYTYEAFVRRTTEIAQSLQQRRKISRGDRVLLAYPPGLEIIAAFMACTRIGAIPVPVYPPSANGFESARYKLNFIAQDCGATHVLTDRTYLWSMKLTQAKHKLSKLSFQKDYADGLTWITTSDIRGTSGTLVEQAHELAFLQYTSGSTNDPKGVMVSHRNLIKNGAAVVDHTPIAVTWLPQYHDMGLIGYYLYNAIKGGTTYGFSPMDFIQRPQLWLQYMSRVRATASSAPNFAYEYCLRKDKVPDEALRGLDLSELRWLMTAAEPVRPHVYRAFFKKFERYGLKATSFFSAYGLAEYTLAVCNHGRNIVAVDKKALLRNEVSMATTAAAADRTELVSCGPALPETKIKIAKAMGDGFVTAGPHEIGEVWLAGSGACLGYWNRPELSDAMFHARTQDDDGAWLRTGDVGFLYEQELYLCSRSKDLIIIRGLNFYPQDIETLVEEGAGIRKGCIAAFAQPTDQGEQLVVVAELKDGASPPDTAPIQQLLRSKLGLVASRYVFIAPRTIPKTSSGKIMRAKTRERWEARQLEIIAEVVADDGAGAWTVEADTGAASGLSALFARHGISPDASETLVDLGLDSMALAEFGADLEAFLQSIGVPELAKTVDLRWLQAIAASALFGLLQGLATEGVEAKGEYLLALGAIQREHAQHEAAMMRKDAELPVHRAPAVHVGDGKLILATGGTGFLGPFLLASLLEQTEDPMVVLVRASDEADAMARLRASISAAGRDDAFWATHQHRVAAVCGDLALPGLGLADDQWRQLAKDCRAVYHNGAIVNYLMDYASMRDANVLGTHELLRLASEHGAKIFNHISTTFIFGWAYKESLLESDNNDSMEHLDFGYSQSKWASEQLVLAASRAGHPARIFRPALITPTLAGWGDSQDIAMRLLAFMLKHGVGTTALNQVSFCPVDNVANNIVAIASDPRTLGRSFHVTRDEYASMADITTLMGAMTGRPFRLLDLADFVPFVIETCEPADPLFPLVNFLVRSMENISKMEFKRYDHANYQVARDRLERGMPDASLAAVVGGILRAMEKNGMMDEACQQAFRRNLG